MIYDQTIHKDLGELFCDAVIKVFGDPMAFLDFLENGEYDCKYDCF